MIKARSGYKVNLISEGESRIKDNPQVTNRGGELNERKPKI